jgi:hypothetical protein
MPPGRQFVQRAIANGMCGRQALHMRDLQALVRSQARLDEVAISEMGMTGMTLI